MVEDVFQAWEIFFDGVSIMEARQKAQRRGALSHLREADPVVARIIEQVGPFRLKRRPEPFQALVRAIVFQQLAGRAAQAIFDRFVALFGDGGGFPSPQDVLEVSPSRLRKAGLSRAKIAYLKDLAAHVADGRIDFRCLAPMDDETIIAELTRVRGIGRWTAEMFLMFNLGRRDVLPVDDLGFRNAVMKAYGMERRPTAKELRALAEKWRPHRSAAVWYLWQSVKIVTPDGAKPASGSNPLIGSAARGKRGRVA
jgi:DNA-3-methyladenine glycosylase II